MPKVHKFTQIHKSIQKASLSQFTACTFYCANWKSVASQFSVARLWPKPIGFQGSSATTQRSWGKIAVVSCGDTLKHISYTGIPIVDCFFAWKVPFSISRAPPTCATIDNNVHQSSQDRLYGTMTSATRRNRRQEKTRHAACKWYATAEAVC